MLSKQSKLSVAEIAVFGMLGALMYASKWLMELLPNIHLIGVFIVAATVVYRAKALYPLYVFVFLTGLLNGFATWWIAYLYIWAILWGMAMLIPKNVHVKAKPFIYAAVCSLHGFLYGVLYLPTQILVFNLKWGQIPAWLLAGAPFDITHGISNFVCGLLIYPLVMVLQQAKKLSH